MDLTACALCVMCVTQVVMTVFICKLTVIMRDIKDEKILVTKIEASGKWV
jgi:hypothetical protein